jgi:hypothetical protein
MHANFVSPPSWKYFLKNYLEDVIAWVAPKLQERILLRACYVSYKYQIKTYRATGKARNGTIYNTGN